MKKSHIYLLLTLVIILASYFRLINLGANDFWVDEFLHLFAAKGLLTKFYPVMPSGLTYLRALPYTFLVAASMKIFGFNAFAARLPSVIFGILMIVAVFYFVKKYCDENTALIACTLIAFDPFSFIWSRVSRMYSMFEVLFFICAMLAFWILNKGFSFDKKYYKKISLFICLFVLMIAVRPIGFFLVPVLIAYVFASYLLNLKIPDFKILGSFSLFASVILITVLFIVGKFSVTTDLIKIFSQINPLFTPILLICLVYCLISRNRFALFVALAFIAPLTIHSLFFKMWKQDRYILYLFPFAYLAISLPVGKIIGMLSDKYLRNKPELGKASLPAVNKSVILQNLIFACLILMIVFYANYMVNKTYDLKIIGFPNYKKAAEIITNNPRYDKDDIIVSTLPMASFFYTGKTDYWLRSNENAIKDKSYIKNGKELEIFTGAILIRKKKDLEKLIKTKKDVWFYTDERILWVDSDIRELLKNLRFIYKNRGLVIYST